MGENDLVAAIGHVLVSLTAANGMRGFRSNNFTDTGVHFNLLIHGIIGFLHYQSEIFDFDRKIYDISKAAAKYLPVACIMARLSTWDSNMRLLHLGAGFLPFLLHLAGKPNPQLGLLSLAFNVGMLGYHAFQTKTDNILFLLISCVIACFLASESGASEKYVFPLGLIGKSFFTYKAIGFSTFSL